MSYRDPGPLPVPSLELIDKTVACLDQSLIDGRGTTGRSLTDAPIVVVHRGSRQRYTDPCGVWLIDRRRVGRVEANEHAPGTAGLLADARQLPPFHGRRGLVAGEAVNLKASAFH